MKLQQELHMQKAFVAPEEELLVSLIATKSRIEESLLDLLSEYGITRPQFNILRILRGAHPGELTCSAINERLVEKNPDTTRLLDRLEAARFIKRERGTEDRRQVFSIISSDGLSLLKSLDKKMLDYEKKIFSTCTDREIQTMISSMEKIRSKIRDLKKTS